LRILLDFAPILPKVSIDAGRRSDIAGTDHEQIALRFMKNTLVVVTDLGSFKAYKLGQTPVKKTPRLELVEEFVTAAAHDKVLDTVSDRAGRYRSPTSRMATPWGEPHNMELEKKRRLIKLLAGRLSRIIGSGVDECHLAASKEINHQLLKELKPSARARIVKNVRADLTKIDKAELLDHF
jgi:Protein required for attachment to host cells